MTRLLAIIAILAALVLASYAHYRLDQIRADTDVTYAMVQRLEQRFINNKMLMLEGKWKRE